MADKTFDAVIVGGGNKALLLALYLVKYGGMSVGVFERRHEIGGCLATEELSAPGFRARQHHPALVLRADLARLPRFLGLRRPLGAAQVQ
jgi:phytoene dehydrogenase-like protein